MRTRLVLCTPLLITVTSVLLAGPASAAPQCVNTGPNTTVCQTPGHSQITTSPDPALQNPLAGWGFGGIGIGLGGVFIGL